MAKIPKTSYFNKLKALKRLDKYTEAKKQYYEFILKTGRNMVINVLNYL